MGTNDDIWAEPEILLTAFLAGQSTYRYFLFHGSRYEAQSSVVGSDAKELSNHHLASSKKKDKARGFAIVLCGAKRRIQQKIKKV